MMDRLAASRLGLLFVVGLLLTVAAARGERIGKHVRVVLDVSGSMQKNDPGRRAVLATLLLHDLAAPNPTLGDSFEILPFERDWLWTDPASPPPTSQRRIRVAFEARAALRQELNGLAYDSRKTYFTPGLRAAIADLERTPGGERDIRTIVLITDGVPEPPVRQRDGELIRRQLVPRLRQHGIRLYVLAFSAEALAHQDFLAAMVRDATGQRLGQVFIDPDGDDLLTNMLAIFARSFGYAPDIARRLPLTAGVDLEAGSEPERVAVVVHSAAPHPPSLTVRPPSGGGLNAPAGVASGSEKGGSFSLLWVLSPAAGLHQLVTDAAQGTVALLRPARLQLTVLPGQGRGQAELTMAETPFPLRVRVLSLLGEEGDPGPVELSFRPLGERLEPPSADGETHRWRGARGAPPAGLGVGGPEGREYEIEVSFAANPQSLQEAYVGYLELEARRGEAIVGARLGDHAHRIEVHPLLAIAPLPQTAYLADRALERREQSCVRFSLTLTAGHLPETGRDRLTLRAHLAPRDPKLFARELRQALFTLDGVALGVAGRPGARAGAWSKGRRLRRQALLAEHELCLRLGEPTRGDPAQPLELPLVMTLVESPYDDFQVVEPFLAKILIAPPGTPWRPLAFLVAALCALASLLWYGRARPSLPRDLAYAVGREDGGMRLRQPDPPSLVRRLFGLVGERPLVAAGGETLAWLRPAREALYRLRPAKGFEINDREGRALPSLRGLVEVAAHHPYQLTGEQGSFLLRLEYSEGEPNAGKPGEERKG